MAVTKKAYPVIAPWTIDQVADEFRHVFQDMGLMADWEDAFSVSYGGLTHYYRVLKVVYDASKTYGQMHYVFLFVPEGSSIFNRPTEAAVYVSLATFWDSTTHNPGGTAKVDYVFNANFKSSTSSWSNEFIWRPLCRLNQSSTVTLYRYSSGINPLYGWLFIKSGTSENLWHITPPGTQLAGWINLDEVCFHGLHFCGVWTSNTIGYLNFPTCGAMRRSWFGGGIFRGTTNANEAYWGPRMSWTNDTHVFSATGNYSSNTVPNYESARTIWLPIGIRANNGALPQDRTPVFTDLPTSFYLLDNPPKDFGIAFHYENRTMERQDIFQVTPGIEEWEILNRANNDTYNVGDGASPLFLALVTGNPPN